MFAFARSSFLIPQKAQAAEGSFISSEYGIFYYYNSYEEWAENRVHIDGKYYDCASGWQQINGKWYYFDPDFCFAYTDGHYEIQGAEYYFDKDGSLKTGWIEEIYTFENGNTETAWYYADPSGKLLSGWQLIGNNWYYFEPNFFQMRSDGIIEIDNTFYFFRPDGAMGTGWCLKEWPTGEGTSYQDWFYAEPDGQLVEGWQYINGAWYYFEDTSGYAPYMCRGASNIGGTWYVFQDSGALVNTAGWVHTAASWFYTNARGVPETGWKYLDGAWYYFMPEWGRMCTNACAVDGSLYTFGKDGVMTGQVTTPGWHKLGNDWFFVQADGKAATGWTTIGNDWYYFLEDGSMISGGALYLDNTDNLYFLLDSGALVSQEGWYTCWDEWFFVGSDGICRTGWQKVGNSWYYLEPAYGGMVSDCTIVLDGIMYTFDANGIWIQ